MIGVADQLLQELRGTATLKELGDRYGVTRERIRQILNEHGIPPRPFKGLPRCLWCKVEIPYPAHTFCWQCWQWSKKTVIICRVCNAHKAVLTSWKNWKRRYDGHYKHPYEYCSRRCAGLAKWDAEIDGSCLRRKRVAKP